MATSPKVPVLRAGDRLRRDEFERRYDAMPELKKAELLEGVVFMPPPVRATQHGLPHALLAGWLQDYRRATPGVAFLIDATVRLDLENEPQPDLMLRVTGARATSRIGVDGYVEGPPELVVEVAASSASYDLHQKLRVYRRSGVREYLVWRAEEVEVDWFVQRSGRYERLAPDAAGVLRSVVFPGLWLDVPALLREDDEALHRAVVEGTRTADHAAFVRALTS